MRSRFDGGLRGGCGTSAVGFSFGHGACFFQLAFFRDVISRRGDNLLRALGADTLDLEIIFVGFGKLLGRTDSPIGTKARR